MRVELVIMEVYKEIPIKRTPIWHTFYVA